MKPRLAGHVFVVLVVLNALLFVFLTLGNMFIFLGEEHDVAADSVYVLRMLWTSMGLSSVMCVAFLFGDVKFGTGLFTPLMIVLAIGMMANVCIDITELAGIWVWDDDDPIAVADFFVSDLLSCFLMISLAIFTYRKQAEAEEIMATLNTCSYDDLSDGWSSLTRCCKLRYVERTLPPLPSSSSSSSSSSGLRSRWSLIKDNKEENAIMQSEMDNDDL